MRHYPLLVRDVFAVAFLVLALHVDAWNLIVEALVVSLAWFILNC